MCFPGKAGGMSPSKSHVQMSPTKKGSGSTGVSPESNQENVLKKRTILEGVKYFSRGWGFKSPEIVPHIYIAFGVILVLNFILLREKNTNSA